MRPTIVKTFSRGDAEAYVLHWQAEPGFPVWELTFYVASTGRVEFGSACWAEDGEPVECPANSPVRKACHRFLRDYMRNL